MVIDAPWRDEDVTLLAQDLNEPAIIHPLLALGVGQEQLAIVSPARIELGANVVDAIVERDGSAHALELTGRTIERDFPDAAITNAPDVHQAICPHALDERLFPRV